MKGARVRGARPSCRLARSSQGKQGVQLAMRDPWHHVTNPSRARPPHADDGVPGNACRAPRELSRPRVNAVAASPPDDWLRP